MENSKISHASVAIARQPIMDAKQAVWAYELLYRNNGNAIFAEVYDDVSATAQVIATSLLDIGMTNLVGNKLAFINFPRSYLLNPSGVPVDRDQVVVEVLETAGYDAMLLAALRKWVKAGFHIALDDFVFEPKLTPFVELAEYVKIDLKELGRDRFMEQVEALKGFDTKIIAEKVETWDEFNFCRLLEVDYYQGFFFENPEVIESKAATVNNMTLLQLMAELLKVDSISIQELERIISQDIGLVHKLLRYLNSPVTGLVAAVDSVRQAVVLVGVDQLKALTNLLLMSELVGDRHALLQQVLVRAKHSELLAERLEYSEPGKYFLGGMLSMIDACMSMSLPDALEPLPIPNEFKTGILNRTGKVGFILNAVEKYDRGTELPESLSQTDLKETYLDALSWVDGFLQSI